MSTRFCDGCYRYLTPRPKAMFYCLDCPSDRRFLCARCTGLHHHVGMNSELHSVEEIAHDQSARVLFCLLFYIIVLPLILAYVLHRDLTTTNYLDASDICPIVYGWRRQVSKLDMGLVYITKSHFAQSCSLEDSYWRFFSDAWFRAVSTDTDSWVLFLVALPKAVFFHLTIRRLAAFLLAVIFAFVNTAMFYVEVALMKALGVFIPEWRDKAVDNMVSTMQCFSETLAEISIMTDSNKGRLKMWRVPPKTYPRHRPPMHFIDWLTYSFGRRLRVYTHHYLLASTFLNFVSLLAMVITFIFRLVCLTSGFGRFLRRLLACCGLHSVMERQRLVFSKTTFSDPLLAHTLNLVHPALDWMHSKVWRCVGSLTFLFVLALLVVAIYFYVVQQKAFYAEWYKAERLRCVGCCNEPSAPCACPCAAHWVNVLEDVPGSHAWVRKGAFTIALPTFGRTKSPSISAWATDAGFDVLRQRDDAFDRNGDHGAPPPPKLTSLAG